MRIRIKTHRPELLFQVAVLRILHDADHFDRFSRIAIRESEALCDRITGCEKLSHHRLGDHGHLLRRLRVLWSKTSSLHEWNSHRGEEVSAHDVVSEGSVLSFRDIVFARVRGHGPEALVENDESKRCRLHAGYLFDFAFNFTQQRGEFWI